MSMNFEDQMQQLIQRIEILRPEGPALERILHRMGSVLETQVLAQIRKKGLVDSGGLLNSIKYSVRLTQGGGEVIVGSYGIKYARIHEFGGTIYPKDVRKLSLPISDRAKESSKNGRGPGRPVWDASLYRLGDVLVDQQTGEEHWLLVDSVTITEKRYMRDALQAFGPHARRILSRFMGEPK